MIRKTRSDKGKKRKPWSNKQRAEIGGAIGLGIGAISAGTNEYLELKDKLQVVKPKLGTQIPKKRFNLKLANNVKQKSVKRLIKLGRWAMTKRVAGKALTGAAVGVVLGRELGNTLLKPKPDIQNAVVKLNAHNQSLNSRTKTK